MQTRVKHFIAIYLLFLLLTSTYGGVMRGKGKRRGKKFDFRAEGGAASFLTELRHSEPLKLDRMMRRVGGRGATDQVAVAAMSAELDKDTTMGIDLDAGAVIYECPGVMLPDGIQFGAEGLDPSASDPLAEQAFQLSSRPTSTRKVYLNFRGGKITNTAWNTQYTNIDIPAYDKDGDQNTFNQQERNDIVAIWRAVSEDYSYFDVDITTIKPSSWVGNGHIVIGGDGGWYGKAGGISFLGVFGDPYYMPSFVFPKRLGPDYAKYVWEAVSHELGHSLGLYHDTLVDSDTSYYRGKNNWAPIMGVGYYQQVTTFDRGEYAGAGQTQDDIVVISKYLPILQQEAGSTIATATPLNITVQDGNVTGRVTGIISQPGVPNMYSFQAPAAGNAVLQADVTQAWKEWSRADVDLQLTVYDSTGRPVGAPINPAGVDTTEGLGIQAATVTLPAAGVYYVGVTNSGAGDPKVDGYSAYVTRGQFGLTLTLPTAAAAGSTNQQQEVTAPPSPSPAPEVPSPSPETLNPEVPSPSPETLAPEVPSPSPETPTPEVPSPSPEELNPETPSSSPNPETPESSPEVPSPSPEFPSPSPEVPSPSPEVPSPSPEVPSPSPELPSPSPEVPSPSPEVPSPSPVVAGLPSPSPELQVQPSPPPSTPSTANKNSVSMDKPLMKVTGIRMTKSCVSSKGCTCYAYVTVQSAANQRTIGGVSVAGTWTSTPAVFSPITLQGRTNRDGVARFSAQRQTSGTCTFTINSVSHHRYALDANSVMTGTHNAGMPEGFRVGRSGPRG